MSQQKGSKLCNVYCQRFGQIAVEMELGTVEELVTALGEQARDDAEGGPHRLLGPIFFEQGLMTPGQMHQVLNRLFSQQAQES